MTETRPPIKVAILGGGMAALTTAFELTDPIQQGRYEVTVYQLGWRLGGKGASGRNAEQHQRIEEHGLHIWFGFYENAFRLIRKCYAELDRQEGPLATVEDAFKPHSSVIFEDNINGKFYPWVFNPPCDGQMPGTRDSVPSLWDYIIKVLEWIPEILLPHADSVLKDGTHLSWEPPHWCKSILDAIKNDVAMCAHAGALPLRLAVQLSHSIDGELQPHHHNTLNLIKELVEEARSQISNCVLPILDREITTDVTQIPDWLIDLRHMWMAVDFALCNIRGVLHDNILFQSPAVINSQDYSDWLRSHGATDQTLKSPLVRVWYESVYAYRNGQAMGSDAQPDIEAGTLLNFIPQLSLGYTGALMWKMQAGMGDTIFTPLYQVLKKRGVEFKFFHRVTALRVAEGELQSVEICRQVQLKDNEYNPLVMVKGLPCWPSTPLYDQIVEGAEIQRRKINLESFWSDWKNTGGELVLKAGEDFDIAVLAISIGAFPFICQELIASNERWRAMVDNVRTIETTGVQLWLKPKLQDLGYPIADPVVGTFTATLLNSWAEMSQLVAVEDWLQDAVQTIAYFTGPFPSPECVPSPSERTFPRQSAEALDKLTQELLTQHIQQIWPNFTWDMLVAPDGVEGIDRLRYQYQRINIDPSERYVLAVHDSSRHRLRADESGFRRLYLAGDWIHNGLNLGCIEATAMSGMQASRAISGHPVHIVGDKTR